MFYLVFEWQAIIASLFCAFCIKCEFAKDMTESTHCVKMCGFSLKILWPGLLSSIITNRLVSSVDVNSGVVSDGNSKFMLVFTERFQNLTSNSDSSCHCQCHVSFVTNCDPVNVSKWVIHIQPVSKSVSENEWCDSLVYSIYLYIDSLWFILRKKVSMRKRTVFEIRRFF